MKRNRWIRLIGIVVSCATLSALGVSLIPAQSTQPLFVSSSILDAALTYQGQLKSYILVNVIYDFQFSRWDAAANESR